MSSISYEPYNKKSFVLKGIDKDCELIKPIGGKWNTRLKIGPSWLVPLENEDDLKKVVAKLKRMEKAKSIKENSKPRAVQKKYHRASSEVEESERSEEGKEQSSIEDSPQEVEPEKEKTGKRKSPKKGKRDSEIPDIKSLRVSDKISEESDSEGEGKKSLSDSTMSSFSDEKEYRRTPERRERFERYNEKIRDRKMQYSGGSRGSDRGSDRGYERLSERPSERPVDSERTRPREYGRDRDRPRESDRGSSRSRDRYDRPVDSERTRSRDYGRDRERDTRRDRPREPERGRRGDSPRGRDRDSNRDRRREPRDRR